VRVGNTIRAEILGHLTEQQVGASSQPRPGHTTCCRGVYDTTRCDQAPLGQREECHEDGSRVAAGICHDGGIPQLSPHELGESVRYVARPVTRTQVGREVDRSRSSIAHAGDPGSRRPVRKGREYELGARERCVIVRDEAHVRAAEARQLATPLVRGREREPHPRVARDERAELASGVAAGTQDANRDSMHNECILLHSMDVNYAGRRSARSERRAHVLPLGHAPCYRLVDRSGGDWVDKRKRHAAILELVGGQSVGSQEELRVLLHRRGWDVTQSTLSRDLRELRLARVPTPEGVRYTVADGAISSAARPALDTLLPQLLTRVDGVGELIVVRTVPGGAQPVASALDGESWPDVLGTVGGDDTILVVCRSAVARERLERRLRKLAEI
jgi:transcriptional regulator of arginine metabolism